MTLYKGRRLYDGDVSIGYDDPQSSGQVEQGDPDLGEETQQDKSDELFFSIFQGEQVVGSIELHDISIDEEESLIGYRIFDVANHN